MYLHTHKHFPVISTNTHHYLNNTFHEFKALKRFLKPKHLTSTFTINSSNLDYFVFSFFILSDLISLFTSTLFII